MTIKMNNEIKMVIIFAYYFTDLLNLCTLCTYSYTQRCLVYFGSS